MKIILTLPEIKQFFPEELNQITQKLGLSDQIKFTIDMAEQVRGYSFQDILNGQDLKTDEPDFNPQNIFFGHLVGRLSRKSCTIKHPLTGTQREYLLSKIKAQKEEQAELTRQERERFAKLSPQEQQNELNKILAELQGPGFIAIPIDRKTKGKK